jgi:hypothetical protein
MIGLFYAPIIITSEPMQLPRRHVPHESTDLPGFMIGGLPILRILEGAVMMRVYPDIRHSPTTLRLTI